MLQVQPQVNAGLFILGIVARMEWMAVVSSQNGIHLTPLCNITLSIENSPDTILFTNITRIERICDGMSLDRKEMRLRL